MVRALAYAVTVVIDADDVDYDAWRLARYYLTGAFALAALLPRKSMHVAYRDRAHYTFNDVLVARIEAIEHAQHAAQHVVSLDADTQIIDAHLFAACTRTLAQHSAWAYGDEEWSDTDKTKFTAMHVTLPPKHVFAGMCGFTDWRPVLDELAAEIPKRQRTTRTPTGADMDEIIMARHLCARGGVIVPYGTSDQYGFRLLLRQGFGRLNNPKWWAATLKPSDLRASVEAMLAHIADRQHLDRGTRTRQRLVL